MILRTYICPKCGQILKHQACCEYMCREWYECKNCSKEYSYEEVEGKR